MRSKRPSASMVVACIALFVALSGGAYAIKLGKNSVKTKNIKNNAVKTAKLANGAVTAPKLANGAVTETKLASAAKGAPAYAFVEVGSGGGGEPVPAVDAARSKNVTTAVASMAGDTGFVCVRPSVPVDIAVVSPVNQGSLGTLPAVSANVFVGAGGCPVATDTLVHLTTIPTAPADTAVEINTDFHIVFE